MQTAMLLPLVQEPELGFGEDMHGGVEGLSDSIPSGCINTLKRRKIPPKYSLRYNPITHKPAICI